MDKREDVEVDGSVTDAIVAMRIREIREVRATGNVLDAQELAISLWAEALLAIQLGHPDPARLARQVLEMEPDTGLAQQVTDRRRGLRVVR